MPDSFDAIPGQAHDGGKFYFSTNKIAVVTFICGPIAGAYYLRKNYLYFGDVEKAHSAIWAGLLFSVVLGVVVPFLPENLPNSFLPAVYCAVISAIAAQEAKKHEEKLKASPPLTNSAWSMVLPGIGFMALFFTICMAVIFLLISTGIAQV